MMKKIVLLLLVALGSTGMETSAQTVTPPPAAAEAGLTQLVRNDSAFTSNSVSTTFDDTLSNGSNYALFSYQYPTQTKADLGRIKAVDGMLYLTGATIATVPWYSRELYAASPNGMPGRMWKYGYFEIEMKIPPTVQGAQSCWSSFWGMSWNAYDGTEHGYTYEKDIFEAWRSAKAVIGSAFYPIGPTLHDWHHTPGHVTGDEVASNQGSNHITSEMKITDGQFHKYALRWVPSAPGSTKGRVRGYIDDQLVVHDGDVTEYETGPGTSLPYQELGPMFLIIGSAKDADHPTVIKSVRVWQQPEHAGK